MSDSDKTQCVLGRFCPEHNFIHGAEAEELRERFEKLLQELTEDVDNERPFDAHDPRRAIQRILDEVDARDSLAHLEWEGEGREPPPAAPSAEFYIVSLKPSGSRGSRDFVLFWRPKNSGYTLFLEAAGRYSLEDVEKHSGYYNNGETTLAVPCDVVEAHAHKAVYSDDFRRLKDARHPNQNPEARNK